jgi:hypothetical protein
VESRRELYSAPRLRHLPPNESLGVERNWALSYGSFSPSGVERSSGVTRLGRALVARGLLFLAEVKASWPLRVAPAQI